MGFLLPLILTASLGEELDQGTFRSRELALGAGGLVAAGGLVLATLALAKTRSIGRRGIFGRALFGITLNGLLVCAALCGVGALMKLSHDLEKLRTQQSPRRPVTIEAASRRLERTRKSLDRTASAQGGDARLVAKASSNYLQNLRLQGDDFAAKLKALNGVSVMDFSTVSTKEELQDRALIVQQFIEANDSFGGLCQDPDKAYRDELTSAGVSPASVAVAVKEFHLSKVSPKPWDANRKWAQAQLRVLQFLEAHWGKWTYTQPKNTLEFDDMGMTKEYERLSVQVDQSNQELTRLRAKEVPRQ